MKIRYDPDANAMMITLREAPVVESDEVGPGVIADFAGDGQIVGIEILHATHQNLSLNRDRFAGWSGSGLPVTRSKTTD